MPGLQRTTIENVNTYQSKMLAHTMNSLNTLVQSSTIKSGVSLSAKTLSKLSTTKEDSLTSFQLKSISSTFHYGTSLHTTSNKLMPVTTSQEMFSLHTTNFITQSIHTFHLMLLRLKQTLQYK